MNRTFRFLLLLGIVMAAPLLAADADEQSLLKSATLYCSFDDGVKADFARGDKTIFTRFNREKEKGAFDVEKGFDEKVFRIAKGRGIAGGALDPADVLPRNGRIFFPAKGNIAFAKGGWNGSVSCWINTNPNELLKTRFCDPIQITQKGANDGGIWFDFNDAKPRDMRMGVFPAVPKGKTGAKEDDADAPMVRMKAINFKVGDWHHIVLAWSNFDTGKHDASASLYVDGKLIGQVKNRDIAMDWEIDKAGIYISINYFGLLDELAIFDKQLTAEEVGLLHKKPGLLQGLKKKD